jgi:hypothetical protein
MSKEQEMALLILKNYLHCPDVNVMTIPADHPEDSQETKAWLAGRRDERERIVELVRHFEETWQVKI